MIAMLAWFPLWAHELSLRVAQDIIPKYGLSLYRPSTLWPPPPDEVVRRGRERFSNQLKSVVLAHAGGVALAPTAPGATLGGIPIANVGSSAISQLVHDGDTREQPSSTSLGDTLLPSVKKLASSPRQAAKKLAPTLSHLHNEETGGSAAPPPTSSEDTRSSRISGQLPRHRLEPIRLQVDNLPVEINSQVQLYCM